MVAVERVKNCFNRTEGDRPKLSRISRYVSALHRLLSSDRNIKV
ncbi:hypothetical protein [Laspinema sp. D2d]|nr:hypothetical protein [Laspinema sp. D2d]